MAVTTEADRKRDEALEHVAGAIKSLAEIVVNECSGHDEYTQPYRERLQRAFSLLIQVRDELR